MDTITRHEPMCVLRSVSFAACIVLTGTITAFAQDISGDPSAGERVFRECSACHAVSADQTRSGPHLMGIIGRPAASLPDARYSDALRNSGIVWDAESLAVYALDPTGLVPGTTMRVSLRQTDGVDDLIAYLATLQSPNAAD